MSDISVDIETLVLDTTDGELASRHDIGQMTGASLQQLLEQQGLPSVLVGSDVPEIVSPDIHLSLSVGDDQMTQEIARSLYRALVETR